MELSHHCTWNAIIVVGVWDYIERSNVLNFLVIWSLNLRFKKRNKKTFNLWSGFLFLISILSGTLNLFLIFTSRFFYTLTYQRSYVYVCVYIYTHIYVCLYMYVCIAWCENLVMCVLGKQILTLRNNKLIDQSIKLSAPLIVTLWQWNKSFLAIFQLTFSVCK